MKHILVTAIIYGVKKEYYENGVLQSYIPYTNGNKNGIERSYYEDGKIQSEIIYMNDTLMTVKHFDENGNEIK